MADLSESTNRDTAAAGGEARTQVMFDCKDGDGPVSGVLIERKIGFVTHTLVRVKAGGYPATVLDTTQFVPEVISGLANPMSSRYVRVLLNHVVPHIYGPDGSLAFADLPSTDSVTQMFADLTGKPGKE